MRTDAERRLVLIWLAIEKNCFILSTTTEQAVYGVDIKHRRSHATMFSDIKQLPLVSVGFPTRNRAHLLPISLGSLLQQTYPALEVIVSDNASTDNTEHVFFAFAEKDKRIRYIRQKENIGSIKNHEYVLQEAKGKYFMWASDDDEWHPQFVEKLVRVLEEHPDYGVAMSWYNEHQLFPDGTIKKVIRTHYFTNQSHQKVFWYHFRQGNSPIFTFGLWRASLLKKIHERPTALTLQGTLPMLAEAALATRFYSVPEPLHTRLQDIRSRLERHSGHPFSCQEFYASFPLTRYFLTMLWRMPTSSVIPWYRKYLFLLPWIRRIWFKKGKIAREYVRWARRMYGRVRRLLRQLSFRERNLARLYAVFAAHPKAGHIVSFKDARKIFRIVHELRMRHALDLGTGIGASAAFIAAALPRDGRVWSVEQDMSYTKEAQRLIPPALLKKIFFSVSSVYTFAAPGVLGERVCGYRTLPLEGAPYDFVCIDGPAGSVVEDGVPVRCPGGDLFALLPHLSDGCVIFMDRRPRSAALYRRILGVHFSHIAEWRSYTIFRYKKSYS